MIVKGLFWWLEIQMTSKTRSLFVRSSQSLERNRYLNRKLQYALGRAMVEVTPACSHWKREERNTSRQIFWKR